MLFVKLKFVDFSYTTATERSKDDVNNYATVVISLGLFYSNYKDSVKQGDGRRVERCWKYLLPMLELLIDGIIQVKFMNAL